MSTTLTDGRDAFVAQPADDEQAAILQAAVRCFRELAFHEVTLESVAAASGLDLATVTARYPTMNDLLVVTVRAWNGRRTEPLLPIAEHSGAVAFLRALLVANVADPALMRLLTAVVNVAALRGHPLSPMLQQQWVQFHAHVQRTLATDIAVGREAASMEAADGAEQLISLYEGIQIQAMLRPNMDAVASFDRAVARLRSGWAPVDAQPLWDI